MNQQIEIRLKNLHSAQRCGAKNRAGGACQCPAMRGRQRCRLHGGLSPGAPRGPRNGNYRSGEWTIEAAQERKWLREL
ncbi:MAG: HGGxSTG domain-containing protein, partial [Rhodoplanes sp.]